MTAASPAAGRRILFDHIPKTGGISLHRILEAKLGKAACSPIINSMYAAARAEFDNYACVSGHIQFEPGADLSDLWPLTIVREPVDRVLSEYYYQRLVVAPDGNPLGELARSLDLDAFVASEDPWILPNISNVMVNHFFVLKWDGRTAEPPERRLELAKEALREYELVGVTERFAETVDLVCSRLGLGPLETMVRENVNSRRPGIADVSKSVTTRLMRHNELDRELYAFACELHDSQRRRVIFSAAAGIAEADRRGDAAFVAAKTSSEEITASAGFGNGKAEILAIEVHGSTILGATLLAGETALIRVIFRAHEKLDDLVVGIHIFDRRSRLVFGTNTHLLGKVLAMPEGAMGHVDFGFPVNLGLGEYFVGATLQPSDPDVLKYYHWIQRGIRFEVSGNIGWHFEGAVKLNVALAVGGAEVKELTVKSRVSFPQRLGRHAPALTEFRATIATTAQIPVVAPGEVFAISVTVANEGRQAWWCTGERNVSVSYHWNDEQRDVVVFEGERSALPKDVQPGDRVVVWAKIRAPGRAGRFVLRLTLVQEFVGWFDELGSPPLEVPVVVIDKVVEHGSELR